MTLAYLLNPDDYEAVKVRAGIIEYATTTLGGFPAFPRGWVSGAQVYVHDKQPRGVVLKGSDAEIYRILRRWSQ